jgi:hypothetical protein
MLKGRRVAEGQNASMEHIQGLIGTLTLPEMLLMTAMGVARENEEGTFDQLLVTPFRPASS